MNGLFFGCSSLTVLPEIEKLNFHKIEELEIFDIFGKCFSLSYLPNIGKWKNNRFSKMNSIYVDCINGAFGSNSWYTKVCLNIIR